MKSTLVVSILMLAIQIAYGQVDTGTVTGVVRDSSGSVVLDAKITVRNLGTGLGQELFTGAEGIYVSPPFPPR